MILFDYLLRRIVPRALHPGVYLRKRAQKLTGCQVIAGPFAGMQYVEDSVWSAYTPKLLGIYERELHGTIEAACRSDWKQIIVVGAAEGYYAVGMALRRPSSSVVAFESLPRGQELLRRLADLNGVAARVQLLGTCTRQNLCDVCLSGALVICDVEGAEIELLDPKTVPALETAFLIVEVHDDTHPTCSRQIRSRFEPTHTVSPIVPAPRSLSDYAFPCLYTRILPSSYVGRIVDEGRPPGVHWLVCTPKATC